MEGGSTRALPAPGVSRFNSELRERLRQYGRNDVRALLVGGLTSIGVPDVRLTSDGALLATIPASPGTCVPTIGFLVALQGPDANEGAAIVITLAQHLLEHADVRHGSIRLGFAPDVEIARGRHRQLPEDLDAAVIYTFKADERRPHRGRPSAPGQQIPGVDGWNRVQDAARLAELCIEAVTLAD